MTEFPWKRYAVTVGIGAGCFLALMLARGGFVEPDPANRWHVICDALAIPGLLFTSIGLLILVSDGGAFDMLKFGIRKLISMIQSQEKRDELPKTYFDYKMELAKRPCAGIGHLIIVGLFFLVMAVIALLVYNRFAPIS